MSDPKKPRPGELVIDASDITVTDINPCEIQKLTKLPDGYERAVAKLAALKPEDIERAGLNPKEIQRVLALQKADNRIGELLPAAERMVEVLNEARILRRHQIAILLAEIAAQARGRADRTDTGVEAPGSLADLLEDSSGPSSRSQATKEKAKAKADVEGQPTP
jgi:hypothetical protein